MKTLCKTISVIVISLIFTSCTSSRVISVLTPAAISFPKDVKKMVVINNSNGKNRGANVLEGVLTGEQVGLDKKASNSCVESLKKTVNESGLYQIVIIDSSLIVNTDGSVNWGAINNICSKEDAQVLITLDKFDSNSLLGAGAVLSSGANRVDGTAIFSIYHPKSEWKKENIKVLDTYIFHSSGSIHPLDILVDVANKKDVVTEMGASMGYRASAQIIPTSINVVRVYYKNGSYELRKSKRLIWYSNWNLAVDKFEMLSKEGSNKQRARATFNLALAKEAQGDLNTALELANRCASEFNLKPSYAYINILKNRIADQAPLNYQLSKEN